MAERDSNLRDFVIQFWPLEGGQYPISAEGHGLPASRANLPEDELGRLAEMAGKLEVNQLLPEGQEQLGICLFDALLHGQVREAYRLLEGRGGRTPLRLILEIYPRELQLLPWECLYDPFHKKYLTREGMVHLLRQVPGQREKWPNQETGDLKILISVARPDSQVALMEGEEEASIDKILRGLHEQNRLNCQFIRGSQASMKKGLASIPDVFHFVGHGGLRGGLPGLYLEDDEGGGEIFETGSSLVNNYFRPPTDSRRRIQLVVLSACETGKTPPGSGHSSLAYQVAGQVGMVLAMQYPIFLDNLTKFNAAFYREWASGATVETALSAGRRAIVSDKIQGIRDWAAPILVSQGMAPEGLRPFQPKPFRGPTYYDVSDRKWFFGRQKKIAELETNFHEHPVTIVTGGSGCGKTSLLRAGLMAGWEGSFRPVYLSLSEKLEADLRAGINSILAEDGSALLPESELPGLVDLFPDNLAVLIDRVEQVEHLGDEIAGLLKTLLDWANRPDRPQKRIRLVLAVRLDERGAEPAFLKQAAPAVRVPRLSVDMLELQAVREWIQAVTQETQVSFLPEAIDKILETLRYHDENERSMLTLQVVCAELYQYALEKNLKEVRPELLEKQGWVEAVLQKQFNLQAWLDGLAVASPGDAEKAKRILSQMIRSDVKSLRPRSRSELERRSGLEKADLDRLLDALENANYLRKERKPGEREYEYELLHEALVGQVDWKLDRELRRLEEIVESAGEILPLHSENRMGLADLDSRRSDLVLLPHHQKMLLRSALEADHEVEYWLGRVEMAEDAFSILGSEYLSIPAQVRACTSLAELVNRADADAAQVREKLWKLAVDSPSPLVREAASHSLAKVVEQDYLPMGLEARSGLLSAEESEALARLHDARPLKLSGLSRAGGGQVRRTLIRLNESDIFGTVWRGALLGALGFGLAAAWIYGQAYVGRSPRFELLALELSLVGLLAFLLALPGALLAPLASVLASILAGGRRRLPAALGALAGGAAGTGLTVVVISALAEIGRNDLLRLGGYGLAGAALGAAVTLPWLGWALWRGGRDWLVILISGVLGGLAFAALSQAGGFWPGSSYMLTLDGSYGSLTRAAAGFCIGAGSAAGLAWGKPARRL